MDYVFIGGEPLNVGRVQQWATQPGNQCRLLHQYGVAECTDVASSHLLSNYSRYGGAVPAGRPVYNTEIRILDENLHELPDNEVGEICISGISVGAGYLNAASSDLRRFAEIHIDGCPVRIYRTGDRGYATKDGELVVVGRVDAQVKIRGMRIDLGDVEHALQAHRWIEDAVVLTMPSEDGPRLVAFVMPAGAVIDIAKLRADLFGVLPRNMVPEEFVTVPSFPMNPNGKVDRLALQSALTR
jgi:acyl-CoA synthetase (AMP-forming)/AMP-acid ligase II